MTNLGTSPEASMSEKPTAADICVALARQLGFHSTGKYEAYRLKQPEGKSAAR
jgi:hypothetical protein